MNERFIRIVGAGLIGSDEHNLPYRQVVFKDEKTGDSAEIHLNKKERPLLWADVEKFEKGGVLPPYRGYISNFNNLDLVVFDTETIDEAFARRKKQLNIKSKISFQEAEAMREKSTGYITNLTHKGGFEISWREISPEANIVKFRAYIGKGKFVWGIWYEIKKNNN